MRESAGLLVQSTTSLPAFQSLATLLGLMLILLAGFPVIACNPHTASP